MFTNRAAQQLQVVADASYNASNGLQPVALFAEDGSPIDLSAAVENTALQTAFNKMVYGPFTLAWDTPNIDTGVTLFTPAAGDRIVGVSVEVTETFDVEFESLGLGITDTTDDDLAFHFAIPEMPDATPSFPRGNGKGVPMGTDVVRLLDASPIKARTVIGGNTAGELDLYVYVYSAVLF